MFVVFTNLVIKSHFCSGSAIFCVHLPRTYCESVFVFLRGNVEVFKVLGITEYTSLALTML